MANARIFGAVASDHVHEPMLTLRRGRSYRLTLIMTPPGPTRSTGTATFSA